MNIQQIALFLDLLNIFKPALLTTKDLHGIVTCHLFHNCVKMSSLQQKQKQSGMKSDDRMVGKDQPGHAFHCHAATTHAKMLFTGKVETAEALWTHALGCQTDC